METEENSTNDTLFDRNISRTRTIAGTNKPFSRILIVDDDNDIFIPIKQILEGNGFQVFPFADPLEALSSFQQKLYDLVLIDIKMLHMNGFESYQQVKINQIKN